MTEEFRVSPQWLRLREPADAAARSHDLVRLLAADLDPAKPAVVHDLGCGTGSQGRWLAPLLAPAQHWVLHDRDDDLVRAAVADPPRSTASGLPVTVAARTGDLAELRADDLSGADVVTASALLDMLTADELDHLVRCCVDAGCPALLTLSVTGHAELRPREALDDHLAEAFDDHQRRTARGRTLLGPDAAARAEEAFRGMGAAVDTRPSPWLLDAGSPQLVTAWLHGWVAAASEQDPGLGADAQRYLARRLGQLEAGELEVTVPHVDLLARPPGAGR